MGLVKGYNKHSGITYVYEQTSTWNPELGRPDNVRKLVGKIDPVTGEIVPTGKRGRPKKEKTVQVEPVQTTAAEGPDYKSMYETAQVGLKRAEAELQAEKEKVKKLEARLEEQRVFLEEMETAFKAQRKLLK